MKVQILFATLVLLLGYLSEAQGSCWRYGHMCWGGHGKRSGGKALMNPPSVEASSAPSPVRHHRFGKDYSIADLENVAPLGGDSGEYTDDTARFDYDAERLALLPSAEEEPVAEDYTDDDVRNGVKAAGNSNDAISRKVAMEAPMEDPLASDVYRSYRVSPKFPSGKQLYIVARPTGESIEDLDEDQRTEDDAVIRVDSDDMDESLARKDRIKEVFEPRPEPQALFFIRMPKRMKENKVAATTTKDKINRERSRRRKWIKA